MPADYGHEPRPPQSRMLHDKGRQHKAKSPPSRTCLEQELMSGSFAPSNPPSSNWVATARPCFGEPARQPAKQVYKEYDISVGKGNYLSAADELHQAGPPPPTGKETLKVWGEGNASRSSPVNIPRRKVSSPQAFKKKTLEDVCERNALPRRRDLFLFPFPTILIK